jgi:hypothetical protein
MDHGQQLSVSCKLDCLHKRESNDEHLRHAYANATVKWACTGCISMTDYAAAALCYQPTSTFRHVNVVTVTARSMVFSWADAGPVLGSLPCHTTVTHVP